VGSRINQVIGTQEERRGDAADKFGTLATVLNRADHRLEDLKETIKGVNDWLHDTQLRQDIHTTFANTKELTAKLAASADKANGLIENANKLLSDTDRKMDELAKNYAAVADHLSLAIADVRKLLEPAGKGEGTLGKLLKDPSLYNDLNDAAKRASKAIDELTLLIQKWKAEGLPVRF
jgi:phospholipid/cholesterol/gamma-HCH transport system substrate-binding protein